LFALTFGAPDDSAAWLGNVGTFGAIIASRMTGGREPGKTQNTHTFEPQPLRPSAIF